MLSVALMLRRMLGAIKYAAKEEGFAAVVGAAIVLILVGTVTPTRLAKAGTLPTGSTSPSAR